jgi:hypothetical protein
MHITIDDLRHLDSLITALDQRTPKSPDYRWLRLYKDAIERRFVPAFHAADGGAS